MQNDIKRVIAYSTCSQLGYMFVAVGVGAYGAGIFHLFTHAFFKALLFLGAGSVIHAMHHEQDMRRMGGLKDEIPFTFWMMMIGTLALTGVGIPFTPLGFAGYVSKDAIIEASYAAHGYVGAYAFLCVVIAAALTSFYSWRLMFMTFYGRRGEWARALMHEDMHDEHAHAEPQHEHTAMRTRVHESPRVMLIPLGVLAFGATFAGMFFRHWFIGGGFEGFWKHSLILASDNKMLEQMEQVPWLVSFLPFLMMVIGFLVAFYMYIVDKTAPAALARTNPLLYRFLLNKWYFDELYDFLFVRPAFWLGRLFWKGGDGTIIDGLGPDGVSARVLDVTRNVVQAADRLRLPLRLRHAARRGGADDLVSVRGTALMSGNSVLSALLILPLVGAALIVLLRGESKETLQNARWIALWTTIIDLPAQPLRLVRSSIPPSPASSSSSNRTGSPTAFSTSSASTAFRCRSCC